MGKKLMLAVAMLALVAAPAFASVQNVKVSGALGTTSIIRNSFDLGAGPGGQTAQNLVASTTSLSVAADLTDNVSTTIKLTNEGAWGYQSAGTANSLKNNNNTFYLDAAYVTMKELLYSPLTLTVGRQPLAYGNQFLIGNNTGNTNYFTGVASDLGGNLNFDAIKAVLSYEPLTVDLFASKINENGTLGQNDNNDTDLYGVNANYKIGDSMNTVVEAYTFVKHDKGAITNVDTKTKNLAVPGLRLSTNPIEGLNVQLEGAYELGNTYNGTQSQKVSAYGLQGMVNYALPVLKSMKPVVSAGYTYLSGDKNTTDNKVRAFDSLYGNQNVGRIFNALFTPTNLGIATAALEVAPIQDVTAKLSLYNLEKVEKAAITSINQPTGAPQTVSGTSKKDLGNELDLDLSYAYTEDVKFGVSAGAFLPGKAFAGTNKDSASQVLTSVNVAF